MVRVVLLSLLAVGTACSVGRPPAPRGAAGDIGPAGGTVVDETGARVAVPAGALPDSQRITIGAAPDIITSRYRLIGPATRFGPDGTQFGEPVTVSVRFADSSSDRLVVLRQEVVGGPIDELAVTQVDRERGVLSAQTSSFSVFQAAAVYSVFVTPGGGAADLAVPDLADPPLADMSMPPDMTPPPADMTMPPMDFAMPPMDLATPDLDPIDMATPEMSPGDMPVATDAITGGTA